MSLLTSGLVCLDRSVLNPNQSNCRFIYERILPCVHRCVIHTLHATSFVPVIFLVALMIFSGYVTITKGEVNASSR